jgi:hypothetical protein
LNLSAVDILDVTGTGTGSSWVIGSYTGTLTGTFDTLNIPSGYTINYGSGTNSLITLNAPVVGIPGDYNNDNKVDAADYVMWRKNPAANGGDPAGYNTWRANFGTGGPGAGSSLGGANAVPEPTAVLLGLLAIGLGAVCRRTSRQIALA